MSNLERLEDYKKILPIIELYPCIQAEGSLHGRPTIAIRTTGCTHRCYFGEGGWCDSWYTSIHPEKGKYSFNDIINIYNSYPEIKHMMVTGGSPTMHSTIVNELTHFANERNIIVTLETEGSHYLETDYPIDLISLSPKFSNSIPIEGILLPNKKKIADKNIIKAHNRYRLNKEAISKMIKFHRDYHFKPVWDGSQKILDEIENFRVEFNIPKCKTWIMPAGDNREKLIKLYSKVIDACTKYGYCFTGREHIIAFDTKRAV